MKINWVLLWSTELDLLSEDNQYEHIKKKYMLHTWSEVLV